MGDKRFPNRQMTIIDGFLRPEFGIRDITRQESRGTRGTDNEYSVEDLTEAIKQGLREVSAYRRGEIDLPTFDRFLKRALLRRFTPYHKIM